MFNQIKRFIKKNKIEGVTAVEVCGNPNFLLNNLTAPAEMVRPIRLVAEAEIANQAGSFLFQGGNKTEAKKLFLEAKAKLNNAQQIIDMIQD